MNFTKRILDILISTILIALLLPLFFIILILIKLDSRGTVIYKRRVVGLNKKKFYFFKFRTMFSDSDEILSEWKNTSKDLYNKYLENYKLENDQRITPIGKFLRKTSLDELPQLFNVLYGTMSLVGPRPVTEDEQRKYSKNHLNTRFTVKPGMTGMWQISGRQDLAYSEREGLDQYYIDNASIALDLIILFKTPLVVLKRKGAL